MSLELRRQR